MNKLLITLFVAFFSLGITGCATRAAVGYGDGPHYHEGPPPHAPAHGYRHKYHHHDMVYDSRVGAYVVVGYNDYFYIDDLYFRYRNGDWQFSVSMDDHDWHHADYRNVPSKLWHSKADRYQGQRKDNDKGHKDKNRKDKDREKGQKDRGYKDHNGNGNGKRWGDDHD